MEKFEHKAINSFLDAGYTLFVTPERYGGGYRALLALDIDAATRVIDTLGGADNEAMPLTYALYGDYAPTGLGDTLEEALSDLSKRLKALKASPEEEKWENLIFELANNQRGVLDGS